MTPLEGTFYRTMDKARVGEILSPARSPEGRFHHDGQKALYLSKTAEGTGVAMARYTGPNSPEQAVVTLHLKNAHVLDLRSPAQCAQFHIDPSATKLEWQTLARPSPTWVIGDAARAAGADGMLYPSRTRPDLTHLVLFRWNGAHGPRLRAQNAPLSTEQE